MIKTIIVNEMSYAKRSFERSEIRIIDNYFETKIRHLRWLQKYLKNTKDTILLNRYALFGAGINTAYQSKLYNPS